MRKSSFTTRRKCVGLLALLLATTVTFPVSECWAASLFTVTPDNNSINEIDADSGALLNSFPTPIPLSAGSSLARSGDVLYFTEDSSAMIYRLDSTNGNVLGSYAAPFNTTRESLAFGETLIVLAAEGGVDWVDPITGAVFFDGGTFYRGFLTGAEFNNLTNTMFLSRVSIISETNADARQVLSQVEVEEFISGIGFVGERLFTSSKTVATIFERDPVTGLIINSFASPGGPATAIAGSTVPEPGSLVLASIAALFGLIGSLRRRRDGFHLPHSTFPLDFGVAISAS